MMQPPFVRTTQSLSTATALALGFLVSVVPAHAVPPLPLAPACTQYIYPEGFAIEQGNGWRVDMKGDGPFPDGDATGTKQGQAPMYGIVHGGIEGRHADFTIEWSTGPVGHYIGDVDDGGIARGSGVDEANPTSTTTWQSTIPFVCVGPRATRPALTGRYRVDTDDAFELDGHPFRGTQVWDITSTCSSEDVCTAQVIPDHHKWTGTAHFSIPTNVSSVGQWKMVVDLPNALVCTDGSGTQIPGRSEYYWTAFMTGNGVPTQSADGGLTWSHGPGCGKPAEQKGAVLTMTKIS